jgi:YD repeat-containing protein
MGDKPRSGLPRPQPRLHLTQHSPLLQATGAAEHTRRQYRYDLLGQLGRRTCTLTPDPLEPRSDER